MYVPETQDEVQWKESQTILKEQIKNCTDPAQKKRLEEAIKVPKKKRETIDDKAFRLSKAHFKKGCSELTMPLLVSAPSPTTHQGSSENGNLAR